MIYAQSILWLILSALCMAQFVAKLPKRIRTDTHGPVIFRYDSGLGSVYEFDPKTNGEVADQWNAEKPGDQSFADFMTTVQAGNGAVLNFERAIESLCLAQNGSRKFEYLELDAPYVLQAGEPVTLNFNPITTEIKINGAIVRKGKAK